ncbi:MAG TPA: XrtA system polysaccharide deacetylase [Candidatus Angelobacter sp.]|nr:XrtA system polysaccharide deacetylase [Candidatus Angelobacter sp.]
MQKTDHVTSTARQSDAAQSPLTHILSVDVEDYFQVEAFAGQVSRESWDSFPSRVVANTQRVLDLFDAYQAKGTFFFVGWVAVRFPHLVREVQSRGHELACHSYWHRTVYSLSEKEFREDTKQAKRAIEDASGVAVQGYRAPSWSITKNCLWALDILAEEGFTYDSSIYPIHHDLYGVPGAKRFPYLHRCGNGLELLEFPPATLRFLATNFPVAGGGYLRIFPSAYTELAFRTFEKNYGERVVVYLHPWELDPEQPRIAGPLKSRLRHYTSLRRMEAKVGTVLKRHKFARFSDVLVDGEADSANAPIKSQEDAQAVLASSAAVAVPQGKGGR